MKISIDDKNYITITNSKNKHSIKFISPDEYFSLALKAYCEYIGQEEIDFTLRTFSSSESVVVFNLGYQVLVSSLVAFELANRMILLNDKAQQTIQ